MSKVSSKDLFRWASFLGSMVADRTKIGKHDAKILKETACMSLAWRKMYSYLEIVKLVEENEEVLKQIDEFLKPCIQMLGQGEWEKDTITDLAMRLGGQEKVYDHPNAPSNPLLMIEEKDE